MGRVRAFCQSLVGKKVIMAVTGVILFLFVVGHLLGNLQIFAGPERLNAYSAFLKGTGEILWAVRVVLLAALILHIVAAVQVSRASKRARPIPYAVKKNIETGYAARTMLWSGPIIFLYVVYHLAMFTFLVTGPGYSPTDVYRNEVLAFRMPAVTAAYILAIVFLGMHLYHGAWSMLQTLGLSHPRWNRLRFAITALITTAVVGGNLSFPIAVQLGILR